MSKTAVEKCGAGSGGTANPTMFALTPAQQRVADQFLLIDEERPLADLSWASELADWIDDALENHRPHIRGERLWIGKTALSGVLGCEANHQAGRGDFAWSSRTARGDIVHRAVAMAAAGSEAEPRDLAWAALDQAQLDGGRSLATWLRDLPESQRVALVAEALPGIDSFLTNWPPLKSIWRPVPEYPVGAEIADGRVKVTGRVDLALGSNRVGPEGGLRRRRMLVDLKSGRPNSDHRAEHLLYALLETLKTGVAPFRAATYYLDEGTWVADTITKELLVVAGRRLIDATQRIIELADGRKPTRLAGWRCSFCPLAEGCPERIEPDG
jgi:hypothetical protein